MSGPTHDGRFIVSCAARTGSSMLVYLLRSHGAILCHNEILTSGPIGPIQGPLRQPGARTPAVEARLTALLEEEPARFLSEVVFDPQGRAAVGFKFKTDEAFDPRLPHINRVHDLIAADEGIGIIRLRRRDLLAQYVSHRVVNEHGGPMMRALDAPAVEMAPFSIDLGHLERYVADVRSREERAGRDFAGHARLDVWYEALVDDAAAVHPYLLAFLGVEPRALTARTGRVLADGRRLVANLDEAVERLDGLGFPDGRYPFDDPA